MRFHLRTVDLFHAMEARSQLRHRTGAETVVNNGPQSEKGTQVRQIPSLAELIRQPTKELPLDAPVALPEGPEVLRRYQNSCSALSPALSQLA